MCPVCQTKLKVNLKFDVVDRFKGLKKVCEEFGFKEEIEVYDNLLTRIEKSSIVARPKVQRAADRSTSSRRNASNNSRSANVNPQRKNPVTNVQYRNKNPASGVAARNN